MKKTLLVGFMLSMLISPRAFSENFALGDTSRISDCSAKVNSFSFTSVNTEKKVIIWRQSTSIYGSQFNLTSWQSPTLISSEYSSDLGYSPVIAPFGKTGDAYAFWSQLDAGSGYVAPFGSLFTTSWSTPSLVESTISDSRRINIFENSDGVVLIWNEIKSEYTEDLFASVITSAGSDTTQIGSTDSNVNNIEATGSAFGESSFALAWTQENISTYKQDIYVSIHDSAGWSTSEKIADSGYYYGLTPSIQPYGDDGFVVVWVSYTNPNKPTLNSITYSAASGWGTPNPIITNAKDGFFRINSIKYDTNKILVTWIYDDSKEIYYSIFTGSWSTPSLLISGTSVTATSLTPTEDGVIAVWSQKNDSTGLNALYGSELSSSGWSTPELLVNPDTVSISNYKVDYQSDSTLLLWINYDSDCSTQQLYAATLEDGVTSGGSGSGSESGSGSGGSSSSGGSGTSGTGSGGTSGSTTTSGGTSGSSTTTGGTTGTDGDGSENADSSGGGGCSFHIQ